MIIAKIIYVSAATGKHKNGLFLVDAASENHMQIIRSESPPRVSERSMKIETHDSTASLHMISSHVVLISPNLHWRPTHRIQNTNCNLASIFDMTIGIRPVRACRFDARLTHPCGRLAKALCPGFLGLSFRKALEGFNMPTMSASNCFPRKKTMKLPKYPLEDKYFFGNQPRRHFG